MGLVTAICAGLAFFYALVVFACVYQGIDPPVNADIKLAVWSAACLVHMGRS
jgi:hypothetical protein